MKNKLLAGASMLAALVMAQQGHANAWYVDFTGPGVTAEVLFTGVPDVSPPDPNPSCGTAGNNPCRSDPAGAFMLTGVSGTFSDSAAGLSNAAITGLIPISPTSERDVVFDPLVPTSLSYIDFADESPPGAGLSYDDLFFPEGNPIDCDFPFSGTLLDVFGTAFTVAGGDTVVLWGDGDLGPDPAHPGPLTYGVAVTDGVSELDYQFSGVSVPEPESLWLLAAGLLLIVPVSRRWKSIRLS